MSMSIQQEASLAGKYVYSKVARLQGALFGSAGAAATARASLARLRRLDTPGGGSWIGAGEELFEGLPELDLPRSREDRFLKAVKASLRLYAFHQQSKQHGMAIVYSKDESAPVRPRSFGWSCKQLATNEDRAKGVVRRMSSVEAARDLDGVELCLRGLIQLMRSDDVTVDYFQLANDLYLLQFDYARSDVFMRWSRDFYSKTFQKNAEAGSKDTSNDNDKE